MQKPQSLSLADAELPLSKEVEKELSSYKKTILTLTEEVDSMRSHVRELEQSKQESQALLEQVRRENQLMDKEKESLSSSGVSSSNAVQREEHLAQELQREKEEKEKFENLLEEEKALVYSQYICTVCMCIYACTNSHRDQ